MNRILEEAALVSLSEFQVLAWPARGTRLHSIRKAFLVWLAAHQDVFETWTEAWLVFEDEFGNFYAHD